MIRRRRRLAGWGLLAALAGPAAAAEALGYVRVGEARLELSRAYAFWVEDEAPGERRILLLLTDRPIDAAVAGVALNPVERAVAELAVARGGLAALLIGEDGREQGLSFWQAAPETAFETTGVGDFELTRRSEGRIAGSWRLDTNAPYEFSLEFDVEISDLAVRGKRLPPGGGEPGAAYLAYAEALRAGDVPALRLLLGERAAATLPEAADPATLAVILSWLQSERPLAPVVRAGLLRGETAVLWVEGADEEGRALAGRVLMARTRSGWSEVEADLRVE